MQKQKSLVAPHMSALTKIGDIVAAGLTSQRQLKDALAISTAVPGMKLKPEHVAEVTTEIDKQIESLQNNKTHNATLAGLLADQLVEVNEELVFNNHAKQNGAGAQDVHVDPQTAGQPADTTT